MIKLINNEFIKVKKSRILFTYILLIISLIIMDKYSNKNILDLSFNLIPFIGIITCILYGGTINGEIDKGTFRYYLTKPYKRWKIYFSKIISIIIYLVLSIIVVMITSIIINNGYDGNYISKYIIHSIPLLFISTYLIYLSTIFKSQTMTSTISILTLSFSLIIAQVLFGIEFNFIEYTFLPYLDYSLFNDKVFLSNMNHELGTHLSINRAILIDLIYSMVFYIIGLVKFNKKDIKG